MFFAAPKIFSPAAPANNAAPRASLSAFQPVLPEVNPNIMSIDIGILSKSVTILTGDPNMCSSCRSVYNAESKLSPEGLWTCEFCGHQTMIGELEEEEVPKEEILDFLLSPGNAGEAAAGASSETIIFVVDISGSMCVTTEIVGTFKLRGDKSKTMLDQLNHGNRNDQYLPGQRRDVTYVSRLQCVQAAIQSQIQILAEQKPRAKVGLVVFNNEVTIYGDGTKPTVIAGDRLYNFEALLALGKQSTIEKTVSESATTLISHIYSIQETGSTALGPAIAVAMGMCSQKPGSKIVIATDGLANTGVGAMDTAEQIEEASKFYAQISAMAKEQALMASVIGIRGDNLNLNLIGQIADTTQGDVNLVDPQNITDTFSSIIDNVIVATNVEVKLILHKGFELSDKDTSWSVDPRGVISRDVGNGYEDTEITVEFKQKTFGEISRLFDSQAVVSMEEEKKEPAEEKKEEKNSSALPEIPSKLPFQVQISYTSLTGQKCLRVITKSREVTDDAAEVTNEMDVALLGMHANMQTATLAQQGRFEEVERNQRGYNFLMEQNVAHSDAETISHYDAWQSNTSEFTHAIQQQQHQQQQQQLHQLQQQQQMFQQEVPYSNAPPAHHDFSSFTFQPQQQQMQDDESSNQIYRNRNARLNRKQWSNTRKYK